MKLNSSKYLSVDDMSGPEQGYGDKRCYQGAPRVVLTGGRYLTNFRQCLGTREGTGDYTGLRGGGINGADTD